MPCAGARMAAPGLRPDEVEIAAVESRLDCALVLAAYVAAGRVGACGSDPAGLPALGASKIEVPEVIQFDPAPLPMGMSTIEG